MWMTTTCTTYNIIYKHKICMYDQREMTLQYNFDLIFFKLTRLHVPGNTIKFLSLWVSRVLMGSRAWMNVLNLYLKALLRVYTLQFVYIEFFGWMRTWWMHHHHLYHGWHHKWTLYIRMQDIFNENLKFEV